MAVDGCETKSPEPSVAIEVKGWPNEDSGKTTTASNSTPITRGKK